MRRNEMANICTDFISTSMPDVSLTAPINDVKELSPVELAQTAAVIALQKYSRVLGRFVEGPHIASCTNFSHADWDRHFEEKLNDTITSISLEKFNVRRYPVEKLVWLGWSVLAVYHLDVEKKARFLSAIVRKLLSEKLCKKSKGFFNKLCEKKDDLLLPDTLFEDIVTISPLYIENLIFDFLRDSRRESPEASLSSKIEVFFQRPDVKSWLKSCSKSPKIFQVFANIINTLLLHLKGAPSIDCVIKYPCLTFASEFHLAVRKHLPENSSIAVLYPLHLQSVVIHLDKPLEYHSTEWKNTNREKILGLLMDGLTRHRNEYLCLLSHFPLWIPNLFQYGIAKGEARLFSNSFLEEDWKPYYVRLQTGRDVKEKCMSLVDNYKA